MAGRSNDAIGNGQFQGLWGVACNARLFLKKNALAALQDFFKGEGARNGKVAVQKHPVAWGLADLSPVLEGRAVGVVAAGATGGRKARVYLGGPGREGGAALRGFTKPAWHTI